MTNVRADRRKSIIKFELRLPNELDHKIEQWAEINGRSKNKEIIQVLKEFYI